MPNRVSGRTGGLQSAGIAVAVGVVGSLLLSLALAWQWLTIGSWEGRWVYEYIRPASWSVVLPFLLVAVASAALIASHRFLRSEWLILGVWIVAATALHAGLRSQAPHSLEATFVSPNANAFYTVTQEHPARDLLERFARVRNRSPLHMRSNMPGKALFLYPLEAVTQRTHVLPWIIVFISNAGAALMFLVAFELFADRRAALYAGILYLFVPARIFFFPLMNTITPVIALAFALLMIRWLQRGSWPYAVAVGLGLFALILFEPLPLVLGVFFLALAWHAVTAKGIPWTRLAFQASAAVAILIATSEMVLWSSGFNLLAAIDTIARHATEFNATADRPYGLWVYRNLVEFTVGAGVCSLVLWAWALTPPPSALVAASLGAVLLITDAIGINRGEVLRLWIFLACFAQLPAAHALAQVKSPLALWLVIVATALPTAIALGTVGFVIP